MTTESPFWSRTKKELESNSELSTFKNWNAVRSIPIYKENEFPIPYSVEVEHLLAHRSRTEVERWKSCLQEPFLGHDQISYRRAYCSILGEVPTTTWVLKSAHHILMFQALAGRSILDYDQIVEFGAGIGETARVILDLGFEGDYYILDLPEVARISEYYLDGRVTTCSEMTEVPKLQKTLFIATWSLSEVPFTYRDELVSNFAASDFLIIYQNKIFDYDNETYFWEKFPQLIEPSSLRYHPIVWHRGAGGNWYLVCTRTTGDQTTSRALESYQSTPTMEIPRPRLYGVRTTLHQIKRAPRIIRRRISL